MGERERTRPRGGRGMVIVTSLAVIIGISWVGFVVEVFAEECWPVRDQGEPIGNFYVTRYGTHNRGGVMVGRFNAIGGYPVNNLRWTHFVLNEGRSATRPDGTPTSAPYVDPPNGGYGHVNMDNEPFLYDTSSNAPNWYQANCHHGVNWVNIGDGPKSAAGIDFVVHLTRVEGRNIHPLLCFRWGFNYNGANAYVTPARPERVNYDPNLTNVLRNEFPGWNVIPPP